MCYKYINISESFFLPEGYQKFCVFHLSSIEYYNTNNFKNLDTFHPLKLI